MILSFLHTPKSGGTSLAEFLRLNYRSRDVYPIHYQDNTNQKDYFCAIRNDLRESNSLIYGHIGHYVHRHLNKDVNYGMVFRQPVERIKSFFKYVYADYKSSDLHSVLRSSPDPFELVLSPDFGEHNLMTKMLSGTEDIYGEANDCTFQRAKSNLENLTFIALTEKMDISIPIICKIMGFRFPINFNINVTSSNLPHNIEDGLNDRQKIIAELNRYDMEIYDLACEAHARLVRTYFFSEESVAIPFSKAMSKIAELDIATIQEVFLLLNKKNKFDDSKFLEYTSAISQNDCIITSTNLGVGYRISLWNSKEGSLTLETSPFYGIGHRKLTVWLSGAHASSWLWSAEMIIQSEERIGERISIPIHFLKRPKLLEDSVLGTIRIPEGLWGTHFITLKLYWRGNEASSEYDSICFIAGRIQAEVSTQLEV